MRYERRVLILFCVGWVLAVTATAWAGSVRTVCANGCEFASLQEAVDSSEWGATIKLGPGVYIENVVLRGGLTISGAGAERTVLDGGSREATLRLGGPLAYMVRLEDLTIRGGYRGGISTGEGEVSLERCVVREAVSGSARFGSRGIARHTNAVIAARAGADWRTEDGVRSSAPSVSSTGDQNTDAVSGGPSDGGLSDVAFASGDSGGGVTLCHIPLGNPENAQTIVVGQAAVAAHLAHEDSLGACPEGVRSPVPQTGQTGCWDASGTSVPCAGTGQDGEYQAGVSMDPRFTDNLDGTVTDNLTGLVWLQDSNCLGRRNWTDALSDSNGLADGSCGLSDGSVAGDWRLPNLKELQSLIDYGHFGPSLPTGYPFSGTQSVRYWSATTRANTPSYAWYVAGLYGNVDIDPKTFTIFAWPVRGGQ